MLELKNFSSLNVKIDNGIYIADGTYNLPNQISLDSKDAEFKSSANTNVIYLAYGAGNLCRSVTITKVINFQF